MVFSTLSSLIVILCVQEVFLISDLLSEVRYIVTVRPDFGSEPGEAASTQAYTRQGGNVAVDI